jgi:hypothetical protein
VIKAKKDEMGFHIRFNKADPRQRKAARILNKVGRQKAILVANALWDYDEDEFEMQEAELLNDDKPKPRNRPKPQVKITGNNDHPSPQKDTNVSSPHNSGNSLVSSIMANMGQFKSG